MLYLSQTNILKRFFILFLFTFLIYSFSFSQTATIIQGVVKDSLTNEPVPFATIKFDNTTIGAFSDENGKFKLSNSSGKTSVTVSILGYKSKSIKIPPNKTTFKDIFIVSEDLKLKEVVVRPKKEKYSKKDNPAVELIKKVINNKKKNNVTSQDYFQCKEYERIVFAFNEFNPQNAFFKHYKFLKNYVDSSIIDNKPILPFSVREKVSELYYRNNPKTKRQITKGYTIEGVDQTFDTDALDGIIKNVFNNVSIFDNSITLLYQDFVGPLSETNSVNFYRWYINDTVEIDNNKYVKLDFAPFNSRDLGFTGNLFISLDSTYAVKKAILKAPQKLNINFVDKLVIELDFDKTENNIWIPTEERLALDLSMFDAVKFYVDKTRTFENFVFNQPMEAIYKLSDPEIFETDYQKRSKDFWIESRPVNFQKDYKMDKMVAEINKMLVYRLILKSGGILSTGYIPLSKDPDVNKLNIGTLPSFFSFNSVEGNRFRLTLATTKNFHPHLFLYGYAAYGTKDKKFKYYGEATWAFNNVQKHKDEFPKNNLIVAYKYDMNSLGQRYTQSERDNIWMSLRSSGSDKLTYNRQTQIAYHREFYNGFSFKLSGQTFNEQPAGKLVFEKMDENGNKYKVDDIKTTEAMIALRYAPNEKFFQQGRKRHSIPSKKFVINLSHTVSFKNVLGSQYDYNKSSFSILKQFWIAPYGKLTLSGQAEKLWGTTPFPLLITPSANNSYTIQSGSFYMLEPLEFIHDSQVSWEVYYYMGGWLFNRIPLLKGLKLREVAGFRGFLGKLSPQNNPLHNHDMLLFPQQPYDMGRKPYLEWNVGIENIFKMFRIDYVRRVNYLDHPNVDKDGFRISFELAF